MEATTLSGSPRPTSARFLSIEDGEVRLARADSVVARSAGAFKSEEPPLTAEELREAAERAIAEEAVERMNG
jgi:hypothetical protein